MICDHSVPTIGIEHQESMLNIEGGHGKGGGGMMDIYTDLHIFFSKNGGL